MSLSTLVLVALSECFDTLAVAICLGIALGLSRASGITKHPTIVLDLARIVFFLTLFQTVNPILGYAVGSQISGLFTALDHWVALGLLLVVGVNMIREGLEKDDACALPGRDPLSTRSLIMLGLATSIDAFAIGIGFAFLEVDIWLAAFIISVATLITALCGTLLGRRFGCLFGNKLDLVGGTVLILIGVHTVLEHTGVL